MSAFTELAERLKKPQARMAAKKERDALVVSTDKQEDKLVKARSQGQCEVFVVGDGRCQKKGMSIHHMLSGWGRRARGRSALAEHKQHVCDGPTGHHRLITGHLLKLLVSSDLPRFDDAYERVT